MTSLDAAPRGSQADPREPGEHRGSAGGAGAAAALMESRTRRLALGCEIGLGLAALLFFPLLVVVPRGIAALASAAGLCAGGLVLLQGRSLVFPRALVVPAALFAALLLWGTASAAWSIDPPRSLEKAARLAGLFAIALAFFAAAERVTAPRRLASLLLAGFVAAMVMATADLAAHGAISKPFSTRTYQPAWLNQASVAFAVLLLPSAAALAGRGRRLAGLLFAAAGAATIFALAGTAAKTALAVGIPVALLCGWRRAALARAAAVLSAVVILTAPLTLARLDRAPEIFHAADWVKLSAGHRLLIWSFVGDRIAEHPLRGWGLDSSRAIPGGGEPIRPGETWLPLHPHDAALQVWLELGAPGAALFALLGGWVWLAFAAARWRHLYAAAAGGSLATAFAAAAATYGIWQEWWLGALFFALFMVLVMARAADGAQAD